MKKTMIIVGQPLEIYDAEDGFLHPMENIWRIANVVGDFEAYQIGLGCTPNADIFISLGLVVIEDDISVLPRGWYIPTTSVGAWLMMLECDTLLRDILIRTIVPNVHAMYAIKIPGLRFRFRPQIPAEEHPCSITADGWNDLLRSVGFTQKDFEQIQNEGIMTQSTMSAVGYMGSFNITGAAGSDLQDMMDFIHDSPIGNLAIQDIDREFDGIMYYATGIEWTLDLLCDKINEIISNIFSRYIGE